MDAIVQVFLLEQPLWGDWMPSTCAFAGIESGGGIYEKKRCINDGILRKLAPLQAALVSPPVDWLSEGLL
ncbi:hypothetical protein [Paenibacillus sabinae]|uniref:Uncharacterized protein n=1 Tax=Paenibacillus sabinae T27 TaxID=1268072 RepID=X4ZUE7_9BACL|nr:hypothetical protein [Paenibacillus sabinae]AHV95424.1 hypothetical protein PSAB_02440 [Paenibacillus sabinae T27]